jgi:hypothetical protein
MKVFLGLIILLTFFIRSTAQSTFRVKKSNDSITFLSNKPDTDLCKNLIQGTWVNLKNPSVSFTITKDSIFGQYIDNGFLTVDTIHSWYLLEYMDTNRKVPDILQKYFGNVIPIPPNVFYGLFICGNNKAATPPSPWIFSIYSLSEKYLRIGEYEVFTQTYYRRK